MTTRVAQRSEATVRAVAGPGSPFLLFVNHTAPHPTVRYTKKGVWQTKPQAEPKYADLPVDGPAPSTLAPSFAEPGEWPGTFGKHMQSEEQMERWHLGRVRSLKSVDDSIASLVRTLDETGELDNTYIILTSDNGFQLGEHDYLTKNILARESLAVPLVISGPGVRTQRSDELVSLLDIPATILDLAAVRPGATQDGLSLRPLLRAKDVRWRTNMLVQTAGNVSVPGKESWQTRGILTQRYLYIRDVLNPDASRMYDRRRDPYEINSVLDDPQYAGVRKQLGALLDRLETCSGPKSCNPTAFAS